MLRLYDYHESGNAYKVRLLLCQLGLPFEGVGTGEVVPRGSSLGSAATALAEAVEAASDMINQTGDLAGGDAVQLNAIGMGGATIFGLFGGLLVLGLGFGLIERFFRSLPGPSWFRRPDTRTDVAYWFFTPLVTKAITRFGVGIAIGLVVVLGGGTIAEFKAEIAAGRFPDLSLLGLGSVVRELPFAVQLVLGFLVSDLIAYWSHRAFHRRPLWGFHAVHHSSPRLDWLSSVRVHPVNDVVMRVLQTTPLLLLGFDPAVFAVVAPFISLYAILLHANVDWTFGPTSSQRLEASARGIGLAAGADGTHLDNVPPGGDGVFADHVTNVVDLGTGVLHFDAEVCGAGSGTATIDGVFWERGLWNNQLPGQPPGCDHGRRHEGQGFDLPRR